MNKAYFKKTRLVRNFNALLVIRKQLDLVANDLKNEPTLRDEAYKLLAALNEGGGASHFVLMGQLRTLIQSIDLKETEEGNHE